VKSSTQPEADCSTLADALDTELDDEINYSDIVWPVPSTGHDYQRNAKQQNNEISNVQPEAECSVLFSTADVELGARTARVSRTTSRGHKCTMDYNKIFKISYFVKNRIISDSSSDERQKCQKRYVSRAAWLLLLLAYPRASDGSGTLKNWTHCKSHLRDSRTATHCLVGRT
jgi:hypothetical protein